MGKPVVNKMGQSMGVFNRCAASNMETRLRSEKEAETVGCTISTISFDHTCHNFGLSDDDEGWELEDCGEGDDAATPGDIIGPDGRLRKKGQRKPLINKKKSTPSADLKSGV